MSLVQINKHYYYYASERVNGVPRRRYIASGEHARDLARLIECERAEHAARLQARRRRQARQADRERQIWEALDGPCRTIENLTRLYLEVHGYHRDGRRWWRKRRTMKASASKTVKAQRKRTKSDPPLPVIPPRRPDGTPAERAEIERQAKTALDELTERSRAGDKAALERLLGYLDALPELYILDAAEVAAQRIGQIGTAQEDLLSPVLGLRDFRQLRDQLAPPGKRTVLERLLASRVALCYMAVNKYEEIQAEQSRIGAAHRRFLSAARTLDLVRRVEPTPVQVNVAQSVHVAAAAIASAPSPSQGPSPPEARPMPREQLSEILGELEGS